MTRLLLLAALVFVGCEPVEAPPRPMQATPPPEMLPPETLPPRQGVVIIGSRWESVDGDACDLDRHPVPGGWIYRSRVHDGVALTFVPAPVTSER